jgi:hypothetical protein
MPSGFESRRPHQLDILAGALPAGSKANEYQPHETYEIFVSANSNFRIKAFQKRRL